VSENKADSPILVEFKLRSDFNQGDIEEMKHFLTDKDTTAIPVVLVRYSEKCTLFDLTDSTLCGLRW
jgi:hypothetical protein